MAKLNISNTRKPLPILKSFRGSIPVNTVFCGFTELLMRSTYYFKGLDNVPNIGDSIFTDINGNIPYNNKNRFIQFKVESNKKYFYKIEGNKITDIEFCKIIDFKQFEVLDQTNKTICQENSFFPDNLTKDAEIFYHDGKGEFPNTNDKVYLTENRFDPLKNFTGLFNILNDTYYYFKTDNTGKVYRIQTCKEIISIPTRTSTLRPHKLNENFYNIFLCAEPTNSLNTIYYKSENEGLPEVGTLIYSNSELTNLITKSSYFVNSQRSEKNQITITSLLIDENGKADYTTCTRNIIVENPDPDPELGVFYFNAILNIDFCQLPSSNNLFTKIYYEDDAETGANFVRPSNGTKVYLDEALTQPYNSSTNGTYGYLYRDFFNNTATYALFYEDTLLSTRICNNLPPEEDNGEIEITDPINILT